MLSDPISYFAVLCSEQWLFVIGFQEVGADPHDDFGSKGKDILQYPSQILIK